MTADRAAAPDLPTARLCFAELGPDGWPLLSLHGTPGCRLDRWPDEAVYITAGVRLITYDRPGYGGSDRLPGRRVVHCVDDVRALLDHLGVDRFSVTGGSGGGPHALAVAARLGPRIHRAQCVVGIVPYGTPGFDWFAGMDPMNVKEFGLALGGRTRCARSHVPRWPACSSGSEDPSRLLGDEWDLSDADRAVMARPELAESIREGTVEMFRQGVDGWIDDSLCFTLPDWGFELSEISIPVTIAWGASDVLVPAAHGAWLAAHVPHAADLRGRGAHGRPRQGPRADPRARAGALTGGGRQPAGRAAMRRAR
jgi:pimeloyl-ACP methyl ester carboxylesterase